MAAATWAPPILRADTFEPVDSGRRRGVGSGLMRLAGWPVCTTGLWRRCP